MINRRLLLGAAGAMPLLPVAAQAAHHKGEKQAKALADALRFPLGDITITALLDGALDFGADVLSGIDQAGFDSIFRDNFRNPDDYRLPVNAFLVEKGDQKILIDAGTGTAMGADAGWLPANLHATGVHPDEITTILATHLHPDHVGGAIMDGAAVFPNAELVVSEVERNFWSDDGNRFEGGDTFFDLAQNVLAAYGDRLKLFDGEREVVSGINALPLPGHSGFALHSGDQSLLMWADIVHIAPVQLARPEVTIAFDTNPEQAANTRKAILDRVVADRMLIAGSHFDFPGLGHIARSGEGYRFVNAPYPYKV